LNVCVLRVFHFKLSISAFDRENHLFLCFSVPITLFYISVGVWRALCCKFWVLSNNALAQWEKSERSLCLALLFQCM